MKNLIEKLKVVCAVIGLILTGLLVFLGPIAIVCFTLWQSAAVCEVIRARRTLLGLQPMSVFIVTPPLFVCHE